MDARIILKGDEEMAGKKDLNRTVRLDQKTDDFLVQIAGKVDCSVSQVVRACVITGAPLLLACPSLIDRVDLDDMDKNMFCA